MSNVTSSNVKEGRFVVLPVSSSFHNSISSFPRTITASATLSGTAISDIFEIVITEELDPIGNNAPPKEAHITISGGANGFSPYMSNLQDKQIITITFTLALSGGTFESVPMGTFYLYNWHDDSNYLTTTLYARDLLNVMDGTSYTGMWAANGINLHDLVVAIIQDFQLQSGITVTYNIDAALQTIITRGLLPLMSHHDALMYVAQAGTAIMWMDRNNVLQIKQSVATQALNTMPFTEELTLAMQETYPKIATQNPYNYFTANLSSYGESSTVSLIFSGIFPITGSATVWCAYNASANGSSVVSTITGGTFVSGVFYADGATITVSGGTGSVKITLNGNTITSTTSQSIVNNSSGQPVNEVDLNNPLLTTDSMVTNVLNWVSAECQGIYLYESECWMDPSLECGDVIYWDSQYSTNTEQAKIIRQEFRFNGTLSGTLNGKGLGGAFTPVSPDSTGGTPVGSTVQGIQQIGTAGGCLDTSVDHTTGVSERAAIRLKPGSLTGGNYGYFEVLEDGSFYFYKNDGTGNPFAYIHPDGTTNLSSSGGGGGGTTTILPLPIFTQAFNLVPMQVFTYVVAISSVAPVTVGTAAGTAPVLPTTVSVTNSVDIVSSVNVIWNTISPSQYANVGTFTVNGTVTGTSILAVATITVVADAPYVQTGLAMYLSGTDFNNILAPTMLPDRSGMGNNGALYGFQYSSVSGSDGNGGIKGDGVGAYIDCGVLPSSDTFSLEMKFNYSGNPSTSQHMFDRSNPADQWPPFGIAKDGNTYINFSAGGSPQKLFNMSQIVPGTVITLSAVWPNVRVYMNGAYVMTLTYGNHFTVDPTNRTSVLRAGEYAKYYSDCGINYVRYYVGHALSDAEVLQNYNVGDVPSTMVLPTFVPSTFRYYQFNILANYGDTYVSVSELQLLNAQGVNVVPTMTGPTTGAVVINESSYYSTWRAWQAFDNIAGTEWDSAAVPTGWITVDLGSPTTIAGYAITSNVDGLVNRSPKQWTVSGSTDGVNWQVLDYQTNQAVWPAAIQTRAFILPNCSITSASSIIVNAFVGIAPTLPTYVSAMSSLGVATMAPVTWSAISPSQYATAGSFAVNGTVTNTSIVVTATVTVNPVFQYYMWNISANNGDSYLAIEEIQLLNASGVNIVPTMTGATTGAITVTASSTYSGCPGWAAFDNAITGTPWITAGIQTGWIEINLGAPSAFVNYTMLAQGNGPATRSPKNWTLSGSLDGAAWTVLDTQINQINWVTGVKRMFAL